MPPALFMMYPGTERGHSAAVFTNPELWASPELMEAHRPSDPRLEYSGEPRRSYPRSQIYGTMRIVVSSSSPDQPYDTAFRSHL